VTLTPAAVAAMVRLGFQPSGIDAMPLPDLASWHRLLDVGMEQS
jgi:hypothetical protein